MLNFKAKKICSYSLTIFVALKRYLKYQRTSHSKSFTVKLWRFSCQSERDHRQKKNPLIIIIKKQKQKHALTCYNRYFAILCFTIPADKQFLLALRRNIMCKEGL